jgi:hypothetical protein
MEHILIYNTLIFYVVTTIGYALSPAMNKSLHAALVKICTNVAGPLFHSPTVVSNALTFWHWNLAFKFWHTLYVKCE